MYCALSEGVWKTKWFSSLKHKDMGPLNKIRFVCKKRKNETSQKTYEKSITVNRNDVHINQVAIFMIFKNVNFCIHFAAQTACSIII